MTTYHLKKEYGTHDCLIVPLFQEKGLKQFAKQVVNTPLATLVREVWKTKDFEGTAMQTSLLYTEDAHIPRVLLVGLGKKKLLTIGSWKKTIGSAIAVSQSKKCGKIGVVISNEVIKHFGAKVAGRESTIAVATAGYAYDEHKTDPDARVTPLTQVDFVSDTDVPTAKAWTVGMREGEVIADGVNLIRHLGNTPPQTMIPSYLAEQAKKLAEKNKKLRVTILSLAEIKKLGMGCFLGVAQGSQHEPKFVIMEYRGGKKSEKPTVFVGKGVTFDSGGLSIKPSTYLCNMKYDMLGAVTAIATVHTASLLGIKKNLIALAPTCENMPGSRAYHPDDILTNMEGFTVEIDNTDAEGRLLLCDALSYAKKFQPKEVIDFATLTGACMVAIGAERSGLFSPVDHLVKALQTSAQIVGESLWHLPLGQEYSESLKSQVADIRQTGEVGGRGFGGASTAAAFLQHFTLDRKSKEPAYDWAHIDMSSSFIQSGTKSWNRGGATGFGLQLAIEYLR